METIKKTTLYFLVVLMLFYYSSCFESSIKKSSAELFAMDTFMSLTCYGEDSENALNDAKDEIERLDNLFSTGKKNSDISLINDNNSRSVSIDTIEITDRALQIYRSTDGAFDITVYPLMKLWGFNDREYHVPSDDEIKKALSYVGSDRISLSREEMRIYPDAGQGIDLGGIAKGYTSDSIMKIFKAHDVVSACVSLGGNVQCLGSKPDGSFWKCGIRDPFSTDENDLMGIVEICDKAVITSGPYQRYFIDEENGKCYHHIIDPKTGRPAENDLASATVICSDGTTADALSTAFFVMGKDKALDYWSDNGNDLDIVLMTKEKIVYVTEGIKDRFSSDYETVIINKK